MKLRCHLIMLFLLLVSWNASAQEDASAGTYLSFIGNQYEEISKAMMSYSSAMAHGKSARKIEKRRNELVEQVKQSERDVRKMKPFNKDSNLRDSVASYLRICLIVLNEDYGKIVNLEDIAEQSYDAMEAYLLAKEQANKKLDEANERVSAQYDKFATNNHIRLIEADSKLSQKVKTAGKVNDYYYQIYLIFFKSYKNEAYFVDGMSKEDINAMEQTKNSLLNSATQDLTKLGKIPFFEGDGSLKTACQQLLQFYKKEATVNFPVMVEFQLKKENFDKMKKALEAKRPADRTQAEIDAFNKSIPEFNAWVKKANDSNNETNKGRTALLNKWNDASESFLDNHTPKYR